MVNFGDALRKGLAFAIEPKRWLPLFILDVCFLGVFFAVFFPVFQQLMLGMALSDSSGLVWLPLAGYILGLTILGISWYILRFWIMGSLIHQSYRPLEIRKGYEISISRLHKLITAAFITGLISGLAGMLYVVGWVLSIIIGIAFFFMMQGIIIDNLGVISTLKSSWKIFRKSMLDVFISWLLIIIISGAIMLLFSLPLIIMFAGFFMNAVFSGALSGAGSDTIMLAMLMAHVETNLGAIAAFGLVALVGMSVAQAFSLKAQTELYLQLRKRFPAILRMFASKVGHFF